MQTINLMWQWKWHYHNKYTSYILWKNKQNTRICMNSQHPSLVCNFVPTAGSNAFCNVVRMFICLHVSALSSLILMMWQFLFRYMYMSRICFWLSWIMPLNCSESDILKITYVLWNNQQMQLYEVNFIPLLGSLYMFRCCTHPSSGVQFLTVSTATGTNHSIVSATYSQCGLV